MEGFCIWGTRFVVWFSCCLLFVWGGFRFWFTMQVSSDLEGLVEGSGFEDFGLDN